MRECAAAWVPVPPRVRSLMLFLDNPEATIVAGHVATGCACWVQDVQLVCDASEVSAQKELPFGRKAGQEIISWRC